MSDSDTFSRPPDTLRERIGESEFKLRILITANRWVITGLVLGGSYVLLLLLGTVGPHSIQNLLTTDAVGSVFSSIIIATVTSVTLVLSISQLVLSQEVGPLGSQRQQLRETNKFREDIEETADIGVSPSEPSQFLRVLIDLVNTRANELNAAVTESGHDDFDDIIAYTDGIVEHGQEVHSDLQQAEFGSFQVILPIVNYNYSWKIAAARHLRDKYASSLSETADVAFDDLIESLRFFAPAREHFKTLYYQWEIVNISRAMLYGAMPTLMICAYMMLVFDPGLISGAVAGVSRAYLFVSATYVISLTPFAILLAYLLRLLTVAKRTLAIGPFILRESEYVEKISPERDPD